MLSVNDFFSGGKITNKCATMQVFSLKSPARLDLPLGIPKGDACVVKRSKNPGSARLDLQFRLCPTGFVIQALLDWICNPGAMSISIFNAIRLIGLQILIFTAVGLQIRLSPLLPCHDVDDVGNISYIYLAVNVHGLLHPRHHRQQHHS